MEIFRGHFNECFSHFGQAIRSSLPRNTKGRRQKFLELAQFCGVGVPAVSDWADNENTGLPKGSVAIKLMFWLNLCGYKIIELERMETTLRGFAELIGFGFLTAEEAKNIIGFSSTYTLYDVFWGKCGYSDEKRMRMWDYWKTKKDLLEQRKIEYFKSSVLIKIFQTSKLSLAIKDSNFGAGDDSLKAVLQIADGLLTLIKLSPKEAFEELGNDEVAVLKELAERLNTVVQ